MIALGVDPGKRTGYCVYDTDDDRDITSGVMDGDDFAAVAALLEEHPIKAVVLEDQFFGFASAFGKLKFYLNVWKVTAKKIGVKFEKPVNPSTWQAYWNIKRGDKEAVVRMAKQITGHAVDYDEADACLIVRCWWAKQQAKELEAV